MLIGKKTRTFAASSEPALVWSESWTASLENLKETRMISDSDSYHKSDCRVAPRSRRIAQLCLAPSGLGPRAVCGVDESTKRLALWCCFSKRWRKKKKRLSSDFGEGARRSARTVCPPTASARRSRPRRPRPRDPPPGPDPTTGRSLRFIDS